MVESVAVLSTHVVDPGYRSLTRHIGTRPLRRRASRRDDQRAARGPQHNTTTKSLSSRSNVARTTRSRSKSTNSPVESIPISHSSHCISLRHRAARCRQLKSCSPFGRAPSGNQPPVSNGTAKYTWDAGTTGTSTCTTGVLLVSWRSALSNAAPPGRSATTRRFPLGGSCGRTLTSMPKPSCLTSCW